jgi:hypothetical protein
MAEPKPHDLPGSQQVETRLHELAQRLRAPQHLEPEVRAALAELVDELGRDIQRGTLSPQELAHLADSAAQLTRALQERHESGLLAQARERLEQAAVAAETRAPFLTGILARLTTALNALGI